MDEAGLSTGIHTLRIKEDDTAILLDSLLLRAGNLLQQFRSFQAYLRQNQKSKDFEARIFRRGVEAEVKSLRALTEHIAESDATGFDAEEQQAKRHHVLRSSNLPFYEAIWSAANLCHGIRALGKRVYWDSPNTPRRDGRAKASSALVDIVSDDGATWTKVSIVTEKRLLYDMAKEGWEAYGPDSESDITDDGERASHLRHKLGKLELVRLAEDLQAAAQAIRIRHKHPTVFFVLPRLTEGTQKEVDAMIADIRATGAIVECGPPPDWRYDYVNSFRFSSMLPCSHGPSLTSTINIDCTMLLAMISDISHFSRENLPPSPTSKSGQYHVAILKQIESEERSPLLPNEIYPVLSERKLVCTDLAAQRMREIVNTMGTASERARADIILGEGDHASSVAGELRTAFRHLSAHPLPDTVHLPILVASTTCNSSSDSPPTFPSAIAQTLATSLLLSSINSSVFMYGWQEDIVTITSNRVVANQIERGLNSILDAEELAGRPVDAFSGPKLWVCESARSLVGKDKQDGLRT